MLMAHPALVNNLIQQYEALRALHAENGSPRTRQRLEDLACSLCVTTGTRDVEAALVAARRRLHAGHGEEDCLLAT
ncbi:hypothetical protein GCM10018793_26970 [Streptomyces sulfonofaciens]|uniref:DUF5133 domain-containing protein n=1 Tax=Streptomyces sulfonofaciens TaxID=68272 RepID=A0A919L042_9ACTN|nr:DUF5133 domain-containing protein [Streptomyces sulfonofaciens]GHH77861.1 hypothetical protein GCM10018793_26970 [Streptomyces sulfonofaciens]